LYAVFYYAYSVIISVTVVVYIWRVSIPLVRVYIDLPPLRTGPDIM